MNVLDENVPESQRLRLSNRGVAARQIGYDLGHKGMQDEEIVALLHHLDRPTFFTLDSDFYDRHLCHARYCLVHLNVDEELIAEQIPRLLKQAMFKTKAQRMGCVIQLSPASVSFWRINAQSEGRQILG